MSIVVRRGMAFSGVADVNGVLARWREKVAPLAAEALARYLASEAARVLDMAAASGSAPAEAPSVAAKMSFDRDVERGGGRIRHPLTDFGLVVHLHEHEGATYGLVATERDDWLDGLCAATGVTPYPYWDNSDRDEGVSAEEWRRRGVVWDAIGRRMRQDGYPSRSVDCGAALEFPSEASLLPFLPAFERRVSRTAQMRTLSALMAETGLGAGDSAQRGIELVNEGLWWQRTDEGKAAVVAEEQRLRPVLVEHVTAEMLRGEHPAAVPAP